MSKKVVEPVKVENKVWNLAGNEKEIISMIDDADGEITEEIETALAKHEANELGRLFTMKHAYDYLENKAARAKALKQEFGTIQKQVETQIFNIKNWICQYMQDVNKKKLEYDLETISIRKSPDRVEIDDAKKIPENFKRFSCTLNSVQKKLLEDACEFAGEDVPKFKCDIEKSGIDRKGILAAYKESGKTKLEVTGTHIESGFTVQFKG